MKKSYLLALILATFCFQLRSQNQHQHLIPQPAEYQISDGHFNIPQCWKVSSQLPEVTTANLLKVLNHPFEIVKKGEVFNLSLIEDPVLGEEAYMLKIKPTEVTLNASSEKGFFYGLQSLYQLAYRQNSEPGKIACCTINDYPRFDHRGLMLDVTRYFIPKEEVIKIIDVASALKLNNLHLHLTDDNGWRMEIKKYPKLTEVGAWRVDRPEIFPGRINPTSPDEPTPVGGFYTQEDLKEIVAYAAEHHINVIPEIEMPAHAAAAIASYPELACPVVDKFVGVFPGIGGSDASIIMCGGNDKVYEFYRDVLDEVMEIFPSKYIHLGGDEANKAVWEKCPLCISKIEEENLKDFEELQAYFMDNINSYVRSKGRTAMGWDEVTYGDPKEDMVILGWQGDGNVAVNDARKSGRKFIMTPAKTLYLIRYQGPQWFEPFTYFGNNTLKDVYDYEAVKDDWTPELKKQLLGIQGSLWTEFCNNENDVEYLVFPRLVAVADAAWRPENSRNWEGFISALDNYLPELDQKNINYASSMYNIQHQVAPTGNGVTVSLDCIYPYADILYSYNDPNGEKSKYSNPLEITSPTTIYATTYKDGEKLGKTLELNLGFNKATGKPVITSSSNNQLQNVITNGLRGSNRQSDFEWAGWYDKDPEFIVDLGETQPIKGAKLGTMAFSHMCVVMPENVELYGSSDGENYNLLASSQIPAELIFAKDPTKYDVDFGQIDSNARYIKVKAKSPGHIPEGFARNGNPSWIYFDELIIE